MYHFLIVEDNYIDGLVTRELLLMHCPEAIITVKNTVTAALDYLNNQPDQPDFIFLDLNLPLKNGYTFLEQFNSDKKDSKIIVLSSHIDPESIERLQNYSIVNSIYSKPLSLHKLTEDRVALS